MSKSAHAKDFHKEAEQTAKEERAIQNKVDRSDKLASRKPEKKEIGAMQAGARLYPEPPLPEQHLKKPGQEADLELAPMRSFSQMRADPLKRLVRDASLVIHPTHSAHTARHGRRTRILLRPFGNHRFRGYKEASDRTRVL